MHTMTRHIVITQIATTAGLLLAIGACGPAGGTSPLPSLQPTVVEAAVVLATGAVQSDDFNTCTLSPFWTVVDPRGGSTVSVAGMGTTSARCEIAIPAGPSHDAWTDGNTGVRIMQASPDGDFDLQAKFDSVLTAGYQTQGFLIEQDATTFLRYDMFFDGSSAYLYTATFKGTSVNERGLVRIANVAPIWLEVVRAGNAWTLKYSTNGTTWTTFLSYTWTATVANAGLWVGNFSSGTAPAFTAKIDYFLNTAAPFAAEDGPLTGTTLTTSVTGSGSINVSPAKAVYYCGETVTLTAVPAAGSQFSGWGGDLSGTNPQATLTMTQSHAVSATFAAGPPPTGLRSDDFNTCTLNSFWTVSDPRGGATVNVSGMGTGNAVLNLSVPAGASHDIWTDGNYAVRAMQAAPNTDFEAQAKFDSQFTAGYQMQGLLVEQDATHLLRFDVVYDGSSVFLYSATFAGTAVIERGERTIAKVSPIWLAVRRVGNQWTLLYSTDGQTWQTHLSYTWTATVSKVGVFAGNYSTGNAPAFPAKVDYFQVTANPLGVEDGPLTGGATLTTNVIGSGSISASPSAAAYYCGETIALTAVPAAGYQFSAWGGDLSGSNPQASLAMTQSRSVTATFVSTTSQFVSDDFNTFNLNPAVWTISDPRSDATFALTGTNTSNAQLRISVPAGVEHDISPTGVIGAPHIMQPAANTDFVLQAKFESPVTQQYQSQGLLVQQDFDTFIRSDIYSSGSAVLLYVAILNNGTETGVKNAVIPAASNYYVRITRAGNAWTVAYSGNGTTWTTGASFAYTMAVASVGLWAGNAGASAPAHTAIVDYFFNNAQPISPEDGATGVVDTFPPNLINPAANPNGPSVTVGWTTDEPADSRVEYGQTTAYELGSVVGNGRLQRDAVVIGNLQTGATYHFRINVTDAAGNTRQSDDLTAVAIRVGPIVDIWYGLTQEFGRIGTPTPFDNVLGRATDPNGVTALSYTLNGGPARSLSMGPDTRRLAQAGDFNIDLPVSSLLPGANQVRITATNGLNQTSKTDVSVVNSHGPAWPLPYSVDWTSATSINSVAQVVDGLWHVDGATVRPSVLAYDRLIGIGDVSWTDYEVLVPITPYAIDPAGYAAPSFGPGVGLLVRWPGHTSDGHQPWEGVYPLGCLAMYRWQTTQNEWQLFGNNGVLLQTSVEPLQLGITYMYRLRVQTDAISGAAIYKLRVWDATTTEPTTWKMTGTQSNDPGHGCLLLLAHHVDATFGPVLVTPGPFGN
jgi:regulation of enolase protein 1 (concanavalin A-like superfamily)